MVARVIIGKHPDTSTVGMWISKSGANAQTSTSDDDFLFSPSKYMSRLYARVMGTQFTDPQFTRRITFSDGSYQDSYRWTYKFAHGLTYVPAAQILNPSYLEDPYIDNVAVTLTIREAAKARYSSSGTFISYIDNSNYYYDPATDSMLIKSTAAQPAITVYRNRIS